MKTRRTERIEQLVTAALLLAVGMLLPFLTGQIKEIGDSLLPMHLAVLLCGLLCRGWYGGAVGLILPFLRSLCFGMPPLYPNAVWMSLELATYGLVVGHLYHGLFRGWRHRVWPSLGIAMLAGRVVWGAAKALLLGVANKPFPLSAFWAQGFLDAIPGILLQFLLIPPILLLWEKRKRP